MAFLLACLHSRASAKRGTEYNLFSRRFDAAEQLYGEAMASDRTGGVEFFGSVRFLSAIGFIQKSSTTRAKEGRAFLEDARTLDKKQVSSAPENPARLYSLAANEA